MVLVAIAGIGGFALSKLDTSGGHIHPPGTPAHSHDEHQEATNTQQETPSLVIVYTDAGFENITYTVKAGETVQIQNNSGFTLNFASDPHPVHTDQPALNIGEIPPDETETFMVDAKGSWGFHNHLNTSHQAALKVQ